MSGSSIQLNTLSQQPILSTEKLDLSRSMRLTFEQKKIVLTMMDTIKKAAENNSSKTVMLAMKRWKAALQEQPYSISTLKISVLVFYLLLTPPLFLTTYASINLLANIKNLLVMFPSGSSSSLLSAFFGPGFQNVYTNEGCALVGFTDAPGIGYFTAGTLLGDAYIVAFHKRLKESYHSVAIDNSDLTPEMREALYSAYNSCLQIHRVKKFYQDPDLLTVRGATHARLAGRLEVIDSRIAEEIKHSDLLKRAIKKFNQQTCAKKIVKIMAVPFLVLLQLFAVSLLMGNIVLMTKTPLSDLFSEDSTKQINEAFIVTQMGSVCPAAITEFMVYLIFKNMFWEATYKELRKEKVLASFEGQFDDLLPDDPEAHDELLRIMELKHENA